MFIGSRYVIAFFTEQRKHRAVFYCPLSLRERNDKRYFRLGRTALNNSLYKRERKIQLSKTATYTTEAPTSCRPVHLSLNSAGDWTTLHRIPDFAKIRDASYLNLLIDVPRDWNSHVLSAHIE